MFGGASGRTYGGGRVEGGGLRRDVEGRWEVEESESDDWTLLVEKPFFCGGRGLSIDGFVEYGKQTGDQCGTSQTGGKGRRRKPWMM